MPDYNQNTLEEIKSGNCSNLRRMEVMAIMKVLENTVLIGEDQDMVPPPLRRLNFFIACDEAVKRLSDLAPTVKEKEYSELINTIMEYLSWTTGNIRIWETASKIWEINSMIFRG